MCACRMPMSHARTLRMSSNSMVCSVCGPDVTPGYVTKLCGKGAAGAPPGIVNPPTSCATSTPYAEPTVAPESLVLWGEPMHTKIVLASELASIAYCLGTIAGPFPKPFPATIRFGADFPNAKFLAVSSSVLRE